MAGVTRQTPTCYQNTRRDLLYRFEPKVNESETLRKTVIFYFVIVHCCSYSNNKILIASIRLIMHRIPAINSFCIFSGVKKSCIMGLRNKKTSLHVKIFSCLFFHWRASPSVFLTGWPLRLFFRLKGLSVCFFIVGSHRRFFHCTAL